MGLEVLEKVRSIKKETGETLYVVKDVCKACGIIGYQSLIRRTPEIYREVVFLGDYGGQGYCLNVTNLAGVLNIILRYGKNNEKEMFDLFAKLLEKEELV